ncbi:MAG: addiction module protein [Anaerolineae bacterium]|nr:addiction module protein [Anaerolineae bacterium]
MEATLEMVLEQAQRLSPQDRLRLVERLAASLQTEISTAPTDWHQALREAYAILKDDPIERENEAR